MKKIKVLQVSGSLKIGGVEKVVVNFLREIDREKFEFDYLVYGDEIGEYEKEVIELGGKIIRIPKPGKGYYQFYKNVSRVMKENGPYDVVHTHVLFNSGFIMKAAKKNKIKIRIAHSHDNLEKIKEGLMKRIYQFFMRRWLIKCSTKMCACSSLAGYYLFGKKRFCKEGILIYNGIDINKYIFDEEKRKKTREEFDLNNEILIGNIGRLENQKNQQFLLEIINKLPTNFKLILIGKGSLEKKLQMSIQRMNLENRVIMTGSRMDIDNLLSAMDIFVLTSIHEGLGIVLIEAQANGLMCIAPKNVVPEEAKVLDNFIFTEFPSNDSIDTWCTEIKKNVTKKRVKNAEKIVKSAGYDCNDIGNILDKIYS